MVSKVELKPIEYYSTDYYVLNNQFASETYSNHGSGRMQNSWNLYHLVGSQRSQAFDTLTLSFIHLQPYQAYAPLKDDTPTANTRTVATG